MSRLLAKGTLWSESAETRTMSRFWHLHRAAKGGFLTPSAGRPTTSQVSGQGTASGSAAVELGLHAISNLHFGNHKRAKRTVTSLWDSVQHRKGQLLPRGTPS